LSRNGRGFDTHGILDVHGPTVVVDHTLMAVHVLLIWLKLGIIAAAVASHTR
jgi:hypothetical protein